MRILIVEDNPDILANLYAFFEPRAYQLDSAVNGYAGLALATENSYDVLIVDVMLPGLNGLQLCQTLRTQHQDTTPVLMLTARDTIEDKIAGFNSGVDDYLVKPFSLFELDVRLQALVRRARQQGLAASCLTVGDLVFDTGTYSVRRGTRPISLTRTGYILLGCLMRAAPRVVSRETLESEVWGEDKPDSDALRTHIHALRQALDKPGPFPMLRTVPGIGFKLVDHDDAP